MDSVAWLKENPPSIEKRIITSRCHYFGESKLSEGFEIKKTLEEVKYKARLEQMKKYNKTYKKKNVETYQQKKERMLKNGTWAKHLEMESIRRKLRKEGKKYVQ